MVRAFFRERETLIRFYSMRYALCALRNSGESIKNEKEAVKEK
jgi:hypothetical protein